MNWLNKLIDRYRQWQRERAVLDTCGCITYCPHCGDILNDNSEWQSGGDESGTYRCKKCDGVSTWHFGAPVPILVLPNAALPGGEAIRAECSVRTEILKWQKQKR